MAYAFWGMFLWMKCLHVEDTKAMIMERALPKDIILLPGQAFMTDPNKASPFMRAAFSLATPEKMDIVSFFLLLKRDCQYLTKNSHS